MRNRSGAWGQLTLLVLSLLGAGIAIYLTTVHYENAPLICSTNGLVDCARVLSSSYSLVPGTTIPISIPGLGWCLVIAVLAILALSVRPEHRWIRMAQFAWSLVGIVAVLYLVYAEIVALHTICAWCTALHVIILVIFLISMVQLRQAEPDSELETEEEERKITTKSR